MSIASPARRPGWGLAFFLTLGLAAGAIAVVHVPGEASGSGDAAEMPPRPTPAVVVPADVPAEPQTAAYPEAVPLPVPVPEMPRPEPSSDTLNLDVLSAANPPPRPDTIHTVARADARPETPSTEPSEPAAPAPPDQPEAQPAPTPTALAATYEAQLARQQRLQPVEQASESMELGGIIVDETITPQGRAFYSAFYTLWQAPPRSGFYTIRVHEEPRPGRGTLVQVLVNDDITYQTRLQPQDAVEDRVRQAARRTYLFVRSGQGQLTIY